MGLNNVLKIAKIAAYTRSSCSFDVFNIEYTIYYSIPVIFCEYSLSQKNRQLNKSESMKPNPNYHFIHKISMNESTYKNQNEKKMSHNGFFYQHNPHTNYQIRV